MTNSNKSQQPVNHVMKLDESFNGDSGAGVAGLLSGTFLKSGTFKNSELYSIFSLPDKGETQLFIE